MGLVDVMLSSLPGDEDHFVKKEQCSFVLRTVDVEGSFEDELTVCSEVRPFPVDEEGLNLLKNIRYKFSLECIINSGFNSSHEFIN